MPCPAFLPPAPVRPALSGRIEAPQWRPASKGEISWQTNASTFISTSPTRSSAPSSAAQESFASHGIAPPETSCARFISSKKAYRGVNVVSLWAYSEERGYSSGTWGTYRQWAEVGAQVRKGEKAAFVIFYKGAGDCR